MAQKTRKYNKRTTLRKRQSKRNFRKKKSKRNVGKKQRKRNGRKTIKRGGAVGDNGGMNRGAVDAVGDNGGMNRGAVDAEAGKDGEVMGNKKPPQVAEKNRFTLGPPSRIDRMNVPLNPTDGLNISRIAARARALQRRAARSRRRPTPYEESYDYPLHGRIGRIDHRLPIDERYMKSLQRRKDLGILNPALERALKDNP